MRLSSVLSTLVVGFSPVFASSQNDSLVPFAFQPLRLGSIKPSGWLQDQMQLMSDGLAGHEMDFYNYVAHSSWLGGDMEYSDLNEGFPYWFNGLVPLAYGLDDAQLKEQVHSAAQTVLDRQASDGWIGPEETAARNFWARYPLFLGLIGLAEANSSWTEPVVSHLHTFMTLMNSMMANNYTGYIYHAGDTAAEGDFQWGQVRSQDMMITLQWLYENYPANQSQLLLENMQYLHNKGYNWENWYNEGAYFGQGMDGNLDDLNINLTTANYPYEHGVNVGQGLKAVAVVRRWNHNDSLIQTAMNGVNWTMTYHGAASGTILADERLDGLAPFTGSELCTSVETMFSLSYLYQALGVNYYADRAELAAFNSLPAMLTPDWWGRQYMEQPNQPYAQNLTESPFYNVNTWGQSFGLEPDYPCCTVNHPQGWPKFLANSYVGVGSSGLAHILLSPGSVETTLSGNSISVSCTTAYPFLDELSYTITAAKAFAFHVRVPAWAGPGSSIAVNSGSPSALSPAPVSGLQQINLPAGKSTVTYALDATRITTQPRANDTVAVYKGALLYALAIASTNTSTLPKPYNNPDTYYPADYAPAQSRDWSYHNTSAWNFAIDPSTLRYHGPAPNNAAYTPANPVFAPGAPPGVISVQGCPIDWPLFLGSVPGYPPTGAAKKCIGKQLALKLVPYASAKTHMAELPVIQLSGNTE